MTKPKRYLTRMVVFLLIVGVAGGFLFVPLRGAFLTNAVLNGVILGALLIGIVHTFRTVTMLTAEVRWLETFQREEQSVADSSATPRLLAPMATMLGERRPDRLSLSTIAMRSLLDGIAARLDESREISRYMIGLLVFLGLLGTFWGLTHTVSSIGDVINGMVPGSGITNAFEGLKEALKAPLAGMGTAFSSSLFGLSGSLILGFLDLAGGPSAEPLLQRPRGMALGPDQARPRRYRRRRRPARAGLYPGAAGADGGQPGKPAADAGPQRGQPDRGATARRSS